MGDGLCLLPVILVQQGATLNYHSLHMDGRTEGHIIFTLNYIYIFTILVFKNICINLEECRRVPLQVHWSCSSQT